MQRTLQSGWPKLGDLNAVASSRDAFKASFVKAYPMEKPGAVPVKAGMLYRFAKEMIRGDVIVYPSRADRLATSARLKRNTRFFRSSEGWQLPAHVFSHSELGRRAYLAFPANCATM
jgi:predicted Mrr-cat superfamily restriction endonuclease